MGGGSTPGHVAPSAPSAPGSAATPASIQPESSSMMEACSPHSQQCFTPSKQMCDPADSQACSGNPDFPICDLLIGLCVKQGAECTPTTVCDAKTEYCSPDAKKCVTSSS